MKQFGINDLFPYQPPVIKHVVDNPFCGLFLDMGMGKTISVLTAINTLIWEELEIDTVLIVAPKRVANFTWPDEVEKWSHLKNLTLSVITGNERQRLAAMREKANIHLISRDNLVWLICQHGGSMLPYDMLVIDESSSFKNPTSMRSKALKQVQACFKRVVILTGTPAPNGLIDLWFQVWLLDRGKRLGAYVTNYKDRFFLRVCKPGSHHGKYVPTSETETKIHGLIKDIVISMKKEDYLDLEPIHYVDIPVRLSAKTLKQYEDFERDRVMELIESEVTAKAASTLMGKLLQFAGGAIYDDEKNVVELHDEKLEALEELVEQANGAPVMIAYGFRHELSRIMERLKAYKPVHFNTEQHKNDWNAGKIQVLVMHPASGGHGLNLQYGGHIQIWYAPTTSLELYQQWNERLARPGQKKQVQCFRLLAEGTEDLRVVRIIEGKENTQAALMEAVKAKISKHRKTMRK